MGSLTDIPFIVSATLVLVISVFTGMLVLQNVSDATNDSQIDQSTLDKGMAALTVFNVGIVLVNLFFYIAGFIFAYRVRTSPVFALPAIIFLGVSGFLSMEISNIYGAVAQVPVFQPVANSFPALNTFMSNYGSVSLVLGGVLVLLLYGKTRSGQEVMV